MTVEEFKKMKPECAHLTGDRLWDAMGELMLQQQRADETIRSAYGFFKRYRLRKLFYWKYNGKMFLERWQSPTRCSVCKKGHTYGMIFFGNSNDTCYQRYCGSCRNELIEEPNISLIYLAWVHWSAVKKVVKAVLNSLYIVGNNPSGRYGMFGDERKYVYWTFNMETGQQSIIHKPRKWWEYIFVKR